MNCSEFEKYNAEVQQKWGNTEAYKEYSEKSKEYSKEKYSSLADDMNGIFSEFAICMKNDAKPDSDEVQRVVKKLQSHITEKYYTCTNEILSGLGLMYISDERFKNNINKNGIGTAEFVSEAIKRYLGAI